MTLPDFPLEPSRPTQERWLEETSRFVLAHLAGLSTAPACGPVGRQGLAIADAVSTPIPEAPLEGGMSAALALVGTATEASLNTAGPGYLASPWRPTGP